MEIMKLIPTGKDYLWGGTRLREEYGKKIDLTPLAETWECSVRQKVGVHEEKKNDNDRSDGSGAGMAGRRFCSGIWNDTGFATGRLAPRGRLPV